jgi:hypothetical protein
MRTSENKNDGTKKPHPAPDPTQPGKGNPGTKIPVSPDEDNDFTKPSKEIKEPENPSQAPVSDPQRQSIPGPDETPGNPGAQKNDPDMIPPKAGEAFTASSNKGMILSLILMLFVSFTSYADDKKLPAKETAVPVEVTVMMNRLEEIKSMDRSELTSAEKKELRKEVRELKKKIADTNGGIYLSAGAVVVIIILLILFL